MPVDREALVLPLVLLVLLAPAVRAADGDAVVPDLEFLEYLGTLVREEDAWLDPSDLRGPAEAERDRVVAHDDRIEADSGSGDVPHETEN